jgi:hypothetical protein
LYTAKSGRPHGTNARADSAFDLRLALAAGIAGLI